jgi:hypothetical protein
MDLLFPGYRIVAHFGGNTQSYPVPADRIVDALANRLSRIAPEIDLTEAEEEAKLLLARVDEYRQEVETDVGNGRLWLSAIDPGTAEGRDLLGAIGVVSFSYPVERGRS